MALPSLPLPLLLLACLCWRPAAVQQFYGASLVVLPGQPDQDGQIEINVRYRESGRESCSQQLQWRCESGDCGSTQQTEVQSTDQNLSGHHHWCQSEGRTTRNVTRNGSFALNARGCCWGSNVNGVSQWMLETLVNTGTRLDTHALNRPPISATVPDIRVPQNCFSGLRLLAHDPDGDRVICRMAAANCTSCHPNITLDMAGCRVHRVGQLDVGAHVFELDLEDHPSTLITVSHGNGTFSDWGSHPTHPPLSQVPLHFTVQILPPVHSCVPGEGQPRFLMPTPLHGDVHHAAVGSPYLLTIRAQSLSYSIFDFQVSGPWNMSKTLKSESQGIVTATVSWLPQVDDLYHHVPVCFTADTPDSQSEMRCIVVVVAKSLALSGEAEVFCEQNRISIAISKASIQGIDQTWLHLRDPTCSLTSNETHIIGTMSLNTCGTQLEDSGDYIVFKNEINSFETPNAVITRRSQVKISFSCQYPKVASVSNYYSVRQSDYLFTESSFGSFGYSFEIFSNGNFNKTVTQSGSPVEVKLLAMLYMGIQATSTLPRVSLFVESCRATPTDNPYSELYYDIIKSGCMIDDTVKVYPSDSSKYNFEIQAFKFTGDYDEVYISCAVILCAEGNPSSRCAQGCLSDPSRRRRDLALETGRHYITQGPLRVVREIRQAEGAVDTSGAGGSSLRLSPGTALFAGLFGLALILLMALIIHHYRKSRPADRALLLSELIM